MTETSPINGIISPAQAPSIEQLPKQPYPFRFDVVDNRETTAPHLKPYKELDSPNPPPLPDPSTYNPTPYNESLVKMLNSIFAVSQVHKDCAGSVVSSIQESMGVKFRDSVENAINENDYVETGGWCDFFRKVAVCLFAAFSIVIGGNMIQDSPLTGGAMIGSGITTLFGNLMIDSNASPEAATFLTILSAGLGLLGGITFNSEALADIAGKIAMAALAIASSVADLGKQFTHYQIEEIRANQTMLQELIMRCRSIIEEQGGHEDANNKMIISSLVSASEGAQAMENAKRMIVANMITANAV